MRRVRAVPSRRAAVAAAVVLLVVLLARQIATARGGTPDPTDAARLSHGAVVVDSTVLVLCEGLECILVLAAVAAGFLGANRVHRRPVAAGAGAGVLASLATWFVAVAALGAVGGGSLDAQAATGLLAVVVLLVVMNWFFHRVYRTGWIASHHRRRPRLFLQHLRLKYGAGVVARGAALGIALTVAVGAVTFGLAAGCRTSGCSWRPACCSPSCSS